MHMIGAAFAITASGVPSYATGFKNGNDIGGLAAAILAPIGGFGKFLLVLMALSVPAACAPTMYTFGVFCLQYRLEWTGRLPFNDRYEFHGGCAFLWKDSKICICYNLRSNVGA